MTGVGRRRRRNPCRAARAQPLVTLEGRPHRIVRRPRLAPAPSAADRALDQAVRGINDILATADSPSEPDPDAPERWLVAVARAEAVSDVRGSPPRTRDDVLSYLALPVSSYSVLDPSWVARAETVAAVEGPGSGPLGDALAALDPDVLGSAFVLSVPVESLTGLPLNPRVVVTVARREGEVRFGSVFVELGLEAADARVQLRARGRLWAPPPRRRRWPPSRSAAERDPPPPSLAGEGRVDLRVLAPGALAAVPAPLLSGFLALVARAALSRLAGPLLSLLADDCVRRGGRDDGTSEADPPRPPAGPVTYRPRATTVTTAAASSLGPFSLGNRPRGGRG